MLKESVPARKNRKRIAVGAQNTAFLAGARPGLETGTDPFELVHPIVLRSSHSVPGWIRDTLGSLVMATQVAALSRIGFAAAGLGGGAVGAHLTAEDPPIALKSRDGE